MKTGSLSGQRGGCNSAPALAHELTTLELSPNDPEDNTSVRIGDKPASRHKRGTQSASRFRFLLLGCISLPACSTRCRIWRSHQRQTPGGWLFFNCLYLPHWDLDFIRRVLWKKFPIGWRRGQRVGSKLCSLCRRVDDHKQVLRNGRFSAFIFDTARKAFGVVQREGRGGRAHYAVAGGTSAISAEHPRFGAVGGTKRTMGVAL